MARKQKLPTSTDLAQGLYREYKEWNHIYHEGCSDPSWEDGINMNLCRNHILYYKKQCEEILGDRFMLYPEEYYWILPPEVSSTFMAVDRILACKGVTLKATNPGKPDNWIDFALYIA